MAYCRWLTQSLRGRGALNEHQVVRLPGEAEWEKAARGEHGREWPWGDEFDPAKCNSAEGRKGSTTPVGAYSPAGDSPYGCADMAGNVWEWCQSLFQGYPYDPQDGREELDDHGSRVLRGGSFGDYDGYVRCAYRSPLDPDYWDNSRGFRVCVAPGRL